MTKQEILSAIDKAGCITWWPGGASHNAVCELRDAGEVRLVDCSTSQETVYEVHKKER